MILFSKNLISLDYIVTKKSMFNRGGSCNFQPSFRGGSVSFVPKEGGWAMSFLSTTFLNAPAHPTLYFLTSP